jgi:beta-phosphoglucomutase-like phosphatase (HAD superfamily)
VLDVEPPAAVAVEDSPNGIAAAKAAGLFCVAAPNDVTAGLDLSEADIVVPTLADLPFERLLELATAS